MQKATSNAPLTLWFPGKVGAAQPWWAPYYDKTRIQFRDRCLFGGVPLPPDLQTTKQVDWSAIDAAGPAAKSKPAGKPAKSAAGKTKKPAAAKPKRKAKVVKIKPKKPPRKPAGGKGRKRAA
jgi:hypothetical protein